MVQAAIASAGAASQIGLEMLGSDAMKMSAFPDWLRSTPIAHRGLHDREAGVPENSLAAFARAARVGYPVELDVHVLADGALAVFHDFTLERMTGEGGEIGRRTLSEIAPLRLLGTAERIPRLEEVLELAAGKTPLLIEAKTRSRTDRRLEEALGKCLDGYEGPFAVQAFNPFSLAWFARHRPTFLRGQLACDFRGERLPRYRKWLLRNLLLTPWSRPHFIHYEIRCLPCWPVTRQRRLGLPILGWCVRSEREAAAARGLCDNYVFEGFRPVLPGAGSGPSG